MRPRRYVPGWLLLLVRPLFRHSASRDAYVLHLVGNRRGPVLRRGPAPEPVQARPVETAERRRTGRFARERDRDRDVTRAS